VTAYGQTNDVGVTDILIYGTTDDAPVGVFGTDSVGVVIENVGSDTANNFQVFLNVNDPDAALLGSEFETYSDTLLAGAKDTVWMTDALSFTSVGEYTFVGFVTLDGDEDNANDSESTTKLVLSNYSDGLPYFQDFEVITTTSFTENTTALGETLQGWAYVQSVDGLRLRFDITNINDNGEVAATLDNPVGGTEDHALIFSVDLSAYDTTNDNIVLEFNARRHNDGDDANDRVWFRTHPDSAWVEIFDLTSLGQNSWQTVEVDLGVALLNEGLDYSEYTQIRFGHEGDDVYNNDGISFNDVQLYLSPTDFEVTALDLYGASEVGFPAGVFDVDTVEVVFQNQNFDTQSNFTVAISVISPSGSTQDFSQTYTGSLGYLESDTVTFTNSLTFSEGGTYQIAGIVDVASDSIDDNDSDTTSFEVFDRYTGTLPYLEDFESVSVAEYTQTVGNIDSTSGIGYYPTQDTGLRLKFDWGGIDNDGNQVATLDNPNADASQFLYLTMDLSAYDTATQDLVLGFEVYRHGDENDADDKVWVRSHPDSSWIELFDVTTIGSTSSDDVEVNISDSLRAFGENYSEYTQFRFGQNDNFPYATDGASYDDISVTILPSVDVEASDITLAGFVEGAPVGAVSLDSVGIEITNTGKDTLFSVPVVLQVVGPAGTQTFNATFSDTLASSQTEMVYVTDAISFTQSGTYTFNGIINLSSDEVESNDSTSISEAVMDVVTITSLPFVEDFESVTDTAIYADAGSIVGISGFGYTQSADSLRLKFNHGEIDDDGQQVATLDNPQTNVDDEQFLYFSADLSAFDTASEGILLSFDLFRHNEQDDANDVVELRPHPDSAWIEILDVTTISVNSWDSVEIDLSDVFLNEGLQYSATTQIRFGQEDNQAFSNDGVSYDDIELSLVPDDLEVTAVALFGETVDAPVGTYGVDSVSVSVQNNSYDTLFGYSVALDVVRPTGQIDTYSASTMDTLAPGGAGTAFVTDAISFPVAGTYYIIGKSDLSTDSISNNDADTTMGVVLDVYDGDLPLREDFEGVTSVISSTTPLGIIPGADGFSYTQETEGTRITFQDFQDISEDGGEKLINLDNPNTGSTDANYVYLNIDMSAFDTATASDDLVLSFEWYDYGDEDSPDDRVWVRGYYDSAWIEVADLTGGVEDQWNSEEIPLTAALIGGDQNFSSTFQVRFGQEDNLQITSDGIAFDNIFLGVQGDVMLYNITQTETDEVPVGFNDDADTVSVWIKNMASEDLSNFDLTLVATNGDESETITETVAGPIASGDSLEYTFTAGYDITSSGVYEVMVYTSLGGEIDRSDDTVSTELLIMDVYAGGLPFTEDFESVTASEYTSETDSVEGIDGFAYTQSVDGLRLKFDHGGIDDDGSQVATLDNPVGGSEDHYLYLNLDLSDYSIYENIIALSFNAIRHNDGNDANDVVEMRVHPDSGWIELYDLTNLGQNAWESIEVNIWEPLYDDTTQYTEFVQIRFGNGADDAYANDGISFDDISLFEKDKTDVGVAEVNFQSASRLEITNDNIDIVIENFGLDTVTNIPVVVEFYWDGVLNQKFTTNYTGTAINPNSTATLTIAPGDLDRDGVAFDVTATTILANDIDNGNDEASSETLYNLVAAEFPVEEGFEDVTTTNYSSDSLSVIEGIDGWVHSANGDENLEFAGGTYNNGNRAALLDGGQFDENRLILSVDMSDFDVSTSDSVLLAFAYYNIGDEDQEEDALYYRTDEDDDWTRFFDWNDGETFGTWQDTTINVSHALSDNSDNFTSTFQILFQQSDNFSSPDDGVVFDDVNLYVVPGLDLELEDLEIVTIDYASATRNDSLVFTVKNVGTETVSSYTVGGTLVGSFGDVTELSLPVSTTLEPDSVDTVYIVSGFDLAGSGSYSFTGYVSLTNDADLSNDTIEDVEQSILDVYLGDLPFFENFSGIPTGSYQEDLGFIPGLRGEGWSYDWEDDARLAIRTDFDPDGDGMLTLDNPGGESFNSVFLTMDLSDYSALSNSPDDLLLDFNWYDHGDEGDSFDIVALRGHPDSAWIEIYDFATNSNNGSWTDVVGINLTDFLKANDQEYSAATQIVFQQNDNFPVNTDGISIDDVHVYESLRNDAGITDAELPDPRIDVTATTVEFTIENFGLDTLTSIPVTVEVTYDESTTELAGTYTGSIAPGETDVVTVSGFDFSEDGEYTISATTSIDPDADNDNDTLSDLSVFNLALADFPIDEGFENVGPTTTFTGENTYEIEGLTGWNHLADGTERVSFNPGAPYEFNGDQAAVLDQGAFSDNQLVLNVDLSAYDTASSSDSIRLDFAYYAMDNVDDDADKVFFRVSEDDDWIELFDWNVGVNDEWIEVSDINVDEALRANRLQFSSTFQLLFQQSDDAAFGTDGLAIDDVRLYSANEEAPTALAFDQLAILRELDMATKFVGVLSTVDPNVSDTTFTYTLESGTGDDDNSFFSITNDTVWLSTDATFDFETSETASIRVQSTDPSGLSIAQAITLELANSNEAPTLVDFAGASVAEDQGNVMVGTLSTVDVDAGDQASFKFVSGTGDDANGSLVIVGNEVYTNESGLSFEDGASQSFRVRATDNGGESLDATFTITVIDGNDAPQAITISGNTVDESTATGTTVATLSTTDDDSGDTFTYTLVDGVGLNDNDKFSITGASLVLETAVDFENEDDRQLKVVVQSEDGSGATVTEEFDLSVTDANDTPTDILQSTDEILENDADVKIALNGVDQDAAETFTYALVAGDGDADNGDFTIDGSFLVLNNPADFETKVSYTARVQATDGAGATFAKALAFNVADANDRVGRIFISNATLEENAGNGAVIGLLSNDDQDEDTYSYSIVNEDEDRVDFVIEGNKLLAGRDFNFEQEATLEVLVQVLSKNGGDVFEQLLEINTINVNDAPQMVGALDDVILETPEIIILSVLEGVFEDEDQGDVLSASVSLADGSALPTGFSYASGILMLDGSLILDDQDLMVEVTDGKTSTTVTFNVQARFDDGEEVTELPEFEIEISIYPNPTSGMLHLSMGDADWSGAEVTITTLTGVQVLQVPVTGAEMDVNLGGLANGAYFITLTDGETILGRTQVVKR